MPVFVKKNPLDKPPGMKYGDIVHTGLCRVCHRGIHRKVRKNVIQE